MEMPLSLPRPLPYRGMLCEGTQFQIKPFPGFAPHGTSKSFNWKIGHMDKITYRISASADFSRRRQRKFSTAKSEESTPRGFMPRTQVPASTQRRDQNNEEKEGRGTSQTTGGTYIVKPELKVESNTEEVSDTEADEKINGTGPEVAATNESLFEDKSSHFEENGRIHEVDDSTIDLTDIGKITESEEKVKTTGDLDISIYGGISNERQRQSKGNTGQWHGNIEKDECIRDSGQNEIVTIANVKQFGTHKAVGDDYVSTGGDNEKREDFLRLKLESEVNLDRQALDRLAEDSVKKRNKAFCYPERVKPDQFVEIYFNRSFSNLKNEPDVMMVGAFNDWKWKSFTIKLSKSYLNGDWWSCQLYVPKEAYKIDFVFYNGKHIYENNDEQDFCIVVEGGMDVFDFENFLLEEKHREQEELARRKAEMERQAEEERRLEAERIASEADRNQAREETAKRRTLLQKSIKRAVRSLADVWYIEPSAFEGNDGVRLYYKKSSGPLSQVKDIWIHGGHNGWIDGLSIVSKLIKSEDKVGDWWHADVVVPDGALVLDWVFADGPPQKAIIYDNNQKQDFHAIVTKSIPEELYWAEEELKVYRRLQAERRLREEATQAKAEKTARLKAEMKGRTLKTFLLSQKNVVYTDPLDVQAGSTVTVFYNPANTVLNGKPEVWFRCSFNRWTHRVGLLTPQKMLPDENGSGLKATVKVPLDAYMMDFVFSEKENGGIFDNKNGMDYHIPVTGAIVQEPPMHIVHIAVEMAPIAKVGGLGDVVTSLSRAIQDMNHNVDIILPKYDCLNLSNVKEIHFHKSYSWGGTEIKVWFGKVEGLPVYFLEPQNG